MEGRWHRSTLDIEFKNAISNQISNHTYGSSPVRHTSMKLSLDEMSIACQQLKPETLISYYRLAIQDYDAWRYKKHSMSYKKEHCCLSLAVYQAATPLRTEKRRTVSTQHLYPQHLYMSLKSPKVDTSRGQTQNCWEICKVFKWSSCMRWGAYEKETFFEARRRRTKTNLTHFCKGLVPRLQNVTSWMAVLTFKRIVSDFPKIRRDNVNAVLVGCAEFSFLLVTFSVWFGIVRIISASVSCIFQVIPHYLFRILHIEIF